ncbi:MAG: glycosyltransferase family 2 protein [bacterium]
MSTVSVCMIVKDEQNIIEDSLNSINDIADEIIITDTGSVDKTKEIAKTFTDKIYDFKWINDFSAAKNFCAEKASCDFIFTWDADFFIKEEFRKKIIELKNNNFNNFNYIRFRWNLEYSSAGIPIKYNGNYFLYERNLFHWEYPVHEKIIANKNTEIKSKTFWDIEIEHYRDKEKLYGRQNQKLEIMQQFISNNPIDLNMLYVYAEDLAYAKKYENAIKVYEQFIEITTHNDLERKMIAAEKMILFNFYLKNTKEAKIIANKYYDLFHEYPRFLLIYADATVPFDEKGALDAYKIFISKAEELKKSYNSYDNERYNVHPYLMISQILIKKEKYNEALQFIEEAIKNTLIEERKDAFLNIKYELLKNV